MNLEEFARFYSHTNQGALEGLVNTQLKEAEYKKKILEIFNSEKTVKEFEDARRDSENRTDRRINQGS